MVNNKGSSLKCQIQKDTTQKCATVIHSDTKNKDQVANLYSGMPEYQSISLIFSFYQVDHKLWHLFGGKKSLGHQAICSCSALAGEIQVHMKISESGWLALLLSVCRSFQHIYQKPYSAFDIRSLGVAFKIFLCSVLPVRSNCTQQVVQSVNFKHVLLICPKLLLQRGKKTTLIESQPVPTHNVTNIVCTS